MRPHRVRLTHHLVVNYGLYKHLNVFRPKKATRKDFTAFHSDDYVQFLQEVTPENAEDHLHAFESFGIGDECPIFDGLYEYCQTYTGGSLSGAARLNQTRPSTAPASPRAAWPARAASPAWVLR